MHGVKFRRAYFLIKRLLYFCFAVILKLPQTEVHNRLLLVHNSP